LVVQFGHRSGLALEPDSRARLRRFDRGGIELEVDGVVELDLAPREPGQTFDVVAGRHRISVRGTAFRVDHRDGALEVACAHGRVVVSDGEREVALDGGHSLALLREVVLDRAARRPIDPARLARLEESLAAPLLPAWTEPRALFETSSRLEMAAAPGRRVRVDGAWVGEGSFALRVMSGRHHIQVADERGAWGPGAWIEAEPGGSQAARAADGGLVVAGARASASAGASAAAPDAPRRPAAGRREARRLRSAQLAAALDESSRARQCIEPLEKRDLAAGSRVLFDIGVNPDGSQGHLNVVESNVPSAVERCLRHLVDSVDLPAGPAATVRYEFAFE